MRKNRPMLTGKDIKKTSHIDAIIQLKNKIAANKNIELNSLKAPQDPASQLARKNFFQALEKIINPSHNITKSIVNYFEPEYQFGFLIYFVQENCHEMVDILLQYGAPVDLEGQEDARVSAILRAAEHADVQMVEKLLKKNPRLNAFNEIGQTAFHNAIGCLNLEMVQAFLKHEPSLINQTAELGLTPLCFAVHQVKAATLQKSLAIIKLLLDSGANPAADVLIIGNNTQPDRMPVTINTSNNMNALHLAIQQGFAPVIRLLHTKMPVTNSHSARDEITIIEILRMYHKNNEIVFKILATTLCELGYLSEIPPITRTSVVETLCDAVFDDNATSTSANELEPELLSTFQNSLKRAETLDLRIQNITQNFDGLVERNNALTNFVKKIGPANRIENTPSKIVDSEGQELDYTLIKTKYITGAKTYFLDEVQAHLESGIISLAKMIDYTEELQYCIATSRSFKMINEQKLFFHILTRMMRISAIFLPESFFMWANDYLENKSFYYGSSFSYENDVIFLLTNHLWRSNAPVTENEKFIAALSSILPDLDDKTHVLIRKNPVLTDEAYGICRILTAILTENKNDIQYANQFIRTHGDINFALSTQWSVFKNLSTKIEKETSFPKVQKHKRAEMQATASQIVTANTTTTSSPCPSTQVQPLTHTSVSETSSLVISPLLLSYRASEGSSYNSNSNNNSNNNLNNNSNLSYSSSSSSYAATSNQAQSQRTTTLHGYHTDKPFRKKERPNAPAPIAADDLDKVKVLKLFNLDNTPVVDANLICINKEQHLWGYFKLDGNEREFGDGKNQLYNRFLAKFKNHRLHFVQPQDQNDWVLALAPKGTDTRVFATEKIQMDSNKVTWTLYVFDKIGVHADYHTAKGQLRQNRKKS